MYDYRTDEHWVQQNSKQTKNEKKLAKNYSLNLWQVKCKKVNGIPSKKAWVRKMLVQSRRMKGKYLLELEKPHKHIHTTKLHLELRNELLSKIIVVKLYTLKNWMSK